MKVILLSILSAMAITNLSTLSNFSRKDKNKQNNAVLNHKLNATNYGSEDPYIDTGYVYYQINPELQIYHTGHGNPDWYEVYDDVLIYDVTSYDFNTVEFVDLINYTQTPLLNYDIEFSPTIRGFNINLRSNYEFTGGYIRINYKFHNSWKDPEFLPDSSYDDADDSEYEKLPEFVYQTESAGNNNEYKKAQRLSEAGRITGKIGINNFMEQITYGIVDKDWYYFFTPCDTKYEFKFTAPNTNYSFRLYHCSKVKYDTYKFALSGVSLNTTKTKTIKLTAGSYYFRVTCNDKDKVVSDEYTIEYSHEIPKNKKVYLRPSVLRSNKMAVWTNDIMADRLTNRFEKSVFELYTYTSSKVKTEEKGYLDPALKEGQVFLDSMFVIWDKDICRALMDIFDDSSMEFLKALGEADKNSDLEDAFDTGLSLIEDRGVIKFAFKIAGKIVKVLNEVLQVFNEALEEYIEPLMCIVKFVFALVKYLVRNEYSPSQVAFLYGSYYQGLHDGAKAVALQGDETFKLVIPRFGKIVTTYTGADASFYDFTEPRPGYVQTKHVSWETTLFEQSYVGSMEPKDYFTDKKCISQFQAVESRNPQRGYKQVSHGSIKLLSTGQDLAKYVNATIPAFKF